MKKTIAILLALIALTALLTSCDSRKSGSWTLLSTSKGDDNWKGSWDSFDGMIQEKFNLDAGAYKFYFDITTESGEMTISIKDKNSKMYYIGKNLETSDFMVEIELEDKQSLLLRVEGTDKKGEITIRWEKSEEQ